MRATVSKQITVKLTRELQKLPDDKKALVLVWSKEAKAISESRNLSQRQKIRALYRLKTGRVVLMFLNRVLTQTKSRLWNGKSWSARLAISGAAIGTAIAGTKGAGIASAGIAFGVPFFLVTASGGALLGVIIEQLEVPPK